MSRLRNKCLTFIAVLSSTLFLNGCEYSIGLDIGRENIKSNEKEIESKMIELIKKISLKRQQSDPEGIVRRFNQPKTIACAHGEMQVTAKSSPQSAGIFTNNARYPVTIRFANATKSDDREADLRGVSVRVQLDNHFADEGFNHGVQDFTMNSYPALFAGTPETFLSFIKALDSDRLWWFLITHPKSLWIGYKARGNPTSPINVEYFSTTPYRHGSLSAVKYALKACDEPGSRVEQNTPHYLRDALQHDLRKTQCLNFQVQFQTDAQLMPMEDASVVWPESISPFVTIAQIILPEQNINEGLSECEEMTFNPWRGLPEHQPLGGINRVRRGLYDEIGKFRTERNKRSITKS